MWGIHSPSRIRSPPITSLTSGPLLHRHISPPAGWHWSLRPWIGAHKCVRAYKVVSIVFATVWSVARQAPLSMGFSSKEYWSRLLCPPPGDLHKLRMEPRLLGLLHWQAGSLSLAPPGKCQEPTKQNCLIRDSWWGARPAFWDPGISGDVAAPGYPHFRGAAT